MYSQIFSYSIAPLLSCVVGSSRHHDTFASQREEANSTATNETCSVARAPTFDEQISGRDVHVTEEDHGQLRAVLVG